MARPTVYTYTLQTSVLPSGTLTVYLYSETNGLTIPTKQTLIVDQDFTERIDLIPGTIEIEQVSFGFVEDYSTYDEGFWYKVLNGYAEIRCVLNDGGAASHLFWGRVIGAYAPFDEYDLTTNNIQRKGSFQCVSMMILLRETTTASCITEALLHKGNFNGSTEAGNAGGLDDEDFLQLRALVASIAKVAFGNSTYSIGLCDIKSGKTDDIQLYDATATTWHNFIDFYMWLGPVAGGAAYLESTIGALYWGTQFPTVWELLSALGQNLGICFRASGDSTQVIIEVLSRGRSFDQATYPVPVESQFIPQTEDVATGVQTSHVDTARDANKRHAYNKAGTATFGTGDLPAEIPTDISVTTQFILDEGEVAYSTTYVKEALFHLDDPDSPSYAHRLTDARFWDYSDQSYDSTKSALVALFYYKFNTAKRSYLRTYGSLKSTLGGNTGHSSTRILGCAAIDDDVASRNFYAIEIRKNLLSNRATVRWAEV